MGFLKVQSCAFMQSPPSQQLDMSGLNWRLTTFGLVLLLSFAVLFYQHIKHKYAFTYIKDYLEYPGSGIRVFLSYRYLTLNNFTVSIQTTCVFSFIIFAR
jgi:hypothetical protein